MKAEEPSLIGFFFSYPDDLFEITHECVDEWCFEREKPMQGRMGRVSALSLMYFYEGLMERIFIPGKYDSIDAIEFENGRKFDSPMFSVFKLPEDGKKTDNLLFARGVNRTVLEDALKSIYGIFFSRGPLKIRPGKELQWTSRCDIYVIGWARTSFAGAYRDDEGNYTVVGQEATAAMHWDGGKFYEGVCPHSKVSPLCERVANLIRSAGAEAFLPERGDGTYFPTLVDQYVGKNALDTICEDVSWFDNPSHPPNGPTNLSRRRAYGAYALGQVMMSFCKYLNWYTDFSFMFLNKRTTTKSAWVLSLDNNMELEAVGGAIDENTEEYVGICECGREMKTEGLGFTAKWSVSIPMSVGANEPIPIWWKTFNEIRGMEEGKWKPGAAAKTFFEDPPEIFQPLGDPMLKSSSSRYRSTEPFGPGCFSAMGWPCGEAYRRGYVGTTTHTFVDRAYDDLRNFDNYGNASRNPEGKPVFVTQIDAKSYTMTPYGQMFDYSIDALEHAGVMVTFMPEDAGVPDLPIPDDEYIAEFSRASWARVEIQYPDVGRGEGIVVRRHLDPVAYYLPSSITFNPVVTSPDGDVATSSFDVNFADWDSARIFGEVVPFHESWSLSHVGHAATTEFHWKAFRQTDD